eukprot:gene10490-7461_t
MSNWNSLKKKIGAADKTTPQAASVASTIHKEMSTPISPEEAKLAGMLKRLREKAVALDCEMVGTGMNGKYSELARCSLVDSSGQVLYDEYVQPKGYVTDFRTQWSGIRRSDINKNKAVTLEEQSIMDLLKGKVLVGHALPNDMKVLMLSHPRLLVRDTSRYPAYMRTLPNGKRRPRALRDLTQQFLNKTIQTGEHDSVEDARCTMELYLRAQREWELHLRQKKTTAREQSTSEKDSTVADASAEVPEKLEDTDRGSVENRPSDQSSRKGTRSEDAAAPRKRTREENSPEPSLKRTKTGSIQNEGASMSQEHAMVSETATKRAWVTKQQRRESRKRVRQSK